MLSRLKNSRYNFVTVIFSYLLKGFQNSLYLCWIKITWPASEWNVDFVILISITFDGCWITYNKPKILNSSLLRASDGRSQTKKRIALMLVPLLLWHFAMIWNIWCIFQWNITLMALSPISRSIKYMKWQDFRKDDCK